MAMQHSCKVCSVFKGDARRGSTTTWYCEKFSGGKNGQACMCNKVHGHPTFESLRFDIKRGTMVNSCHRTCTFATIRAHTDCHRDGIRRVRT